jgi:hypothetical protein
LSEEQTPHIVEKPKNRRYALEPKEARCGLHTQEVAGSSPAAPTISTEGRRGSSPTMGATPPAAASECDRLNPRLDVRAQALACCFAVGHSSLGPLSASNGGNVLIVGRRWMAATSRVKTSWCVVEGFSERRKFRQLAILLTGLFRPRRYLFIAPAWARSLPHGRALLDNPRWS